ncbi:MAG: hypothetical protein K6E51_11250 [Treponema sp.]|nr:hypothetical protein [Treponema sp.]
MYDNDKDKENQNPLDDLDGGLKKAKNTAHKVTDLTDNAKKAQQMLNNYKAGKAKKATSDVQKTNKVESGTTGKIKSAFNKFMGKKAKPTAPVNNLAKKGLKHLLHTMFAPILLPLLLLFVVVALIASIFMFTTPSSMGEAYTTEIGIDDSDGEDSKTSKAIEDLDDSNSSSDLSIGSLIKGLFKKIVMTVKEYFGHWNDLSGGDDVNADDEDIFSQTYYKDARRNKKVMVKHLKRCRSNLYDYVYPMFKIIIKSPRLDFPYTSS